MTQADNQSWDIATSVGATAVVVAMARAAETNSADPLIRDQFAEPLVATPALAQLRDEASSWINSDNPDNPNSERDATDFRHLIAYMAVRTHYLDAFFAAAADKGIDQHVILAAGLDSRAFRLDWPAGTVVYEIDMPAVLEYKGATMDALGVQPTAIRRAVGVDLRQDWPAALRAAGFDPTRPTTWLAEGLLPYLPAEAKEALFTNIDELSPPGSRVAVTQFDIRRPEVAQHLQHLREAREQHSKPGDIDPPQLWYGDEGRPNSAEWFESRNWTTQSVDSREEAERLGRPSPSPRKDRQSFDPFISSFITAELPARP